MRTPIVLVIFTALVCAGLLGIVGYTQAQVSPKAERTMVLNGALTQRYTVGDGYIEFGATVTPPFVNEEGDPLNHEDLILVDVFLLGSMNAAHSTYLSYIEDDFNNKYKNTKQKYLLEYYLADDVEKEAVLTREVCFAGISGTYMALNGESEVFVECNTEYKDPGATAMDDCDGDLTSKISIGGLVNFKKVGSYNRRYIVKSALGEQSEVVRKINVVDTTPPDLKLAGRAIVNIPLNGLFDDPGALASDSCEGDLTAAIVVDDSALDESTAGDYEVWYTVADSHGNEASISRIVRVACESPGPEITLYGDAEVVTECGDAFKDPGFEAWDRCDEYITDLVEISDDGTFDTVGVVTRTYRVSNFEGVTAEVTRTITTVDTTGPMISLNGKAALELLQGESYVELGASAYDACEGVTAVEILGDTVDTEEIGYYTVLYRAVDSLGNESLKERFIRVGCGELNFKLSGLSTMYVECGEEYEEPGFEAGDHCIEDLSDMVVISYPLGEVDHTAPGRYTIWYELLGKRLVRTVHVADTLKPEIVLEGKENMTVFIGTPFVEPGATAMDQCFGDLTDKLNISGAVDIFTEGTYLITYRVADPQGNVATRIRVVEVGYDPEKPIVKLYGDPIMTIECGDGFEDPGAYAYNDLETKEYPVTASKLPAQALLTPGEYVIIYSATNELGNTFDVSRKIIVVDSQAPVITLRGPEEVIVDQGDPYVDLGILSALDRCDGDLKSSVLFQSTVDTSATGIYHVEYFVRDSSGNRGTALRTVQVRAVSVTPEGEAVVVEGEEVTPVEGEAVAEEGEVEGEDEEECAGCGCTPDKNLCWLGNLFLAGLSIAFVFFITCLFENCK